MKLPMGKITVKIKRETLFEYLFVTLLIFECYSIFMHTVNKPSWLSYMIVILFAVALAGCTFKIQFTHHQLITTLWQVILIWVYLGVFIIVMPFNVTSLIRIGIVLTFLFIFYTLYCKNNGFSIMLKYRNIIFILALISLFFWFFGFILGWLKPNTFVISTWTTHQEKVYEMFFYLSGSTQNISMFGITNIPRNTSIFTEAPMSSLHFSLAYIFEEFKNPKGKIYIKLVLMVAILSTFSTTGYMILIMALMVEFMRMKTSNRLIQAFKYLAVIFVVIAGCYALYYLFSGKMGTGSGSKRLSDFVYGFQYWLQKPIWGYGYQYEDISGTGFSNSITPILLSGGLYATILYDYSFIKGIYVSVCKKDWNGLIFIVLFLIMFTLTIIPFKYLTFFVLIYISSDGEEEMRDKEGNFKLTKRSLQTNSPSKYGNT